MRRTLVLFLALATLAGCARPARAPSAEPAGAAPVDPARFDAAARNGDTVYRVAPGSSLILIRVGRAGPLKHLGHDHAIASEDLQGYVQVAADPGRSRAELALPLATLIVDRDEYRARAGLEGGVPADAIEGTTANMHKVLDSARSPWLRIAARSAAGAQGATPLTVEFEIAGHTATYSLPADWEVSEETLTASGRLTVTHADLGLEPFSAVGGLLRVAEEIELEFDIVAERVPGGTPIAVTTTVHAGGCG